MTDLPEAERDGLTGAYRSHRLIKRIQAAMTAGETLYLLCLDVQGMNQLNDLHSMMNGDRVLQAVADSFRERVGAEQMYRIGSDELLIDLGKNDYPQIPELILDPQAFRAWTVDSEAEAVLLAAKGLVRVPLRHCLLELKAEFPPTLNRKAFSYLRLAQDLAMLLIDKAFLDAPVDGARYCHCLSEVSVKQLQV